MSLPINKFDMSTIKHRNNSGITDNSGNIIRLIGKRDTGIAWIKRPTPLQSKQNCDK